MASGSGGLLQGLRVVESSRGRASTAGWLLAELGADVVRLLDPPAHRLPRRDRLSDDVVELVEGLGQAVAVGDLDDPAELRLLRELLQGADVWIDGHDPAQLAGHGLDPTHPGPDLSHLVVVSTSDFGLVGPRSPWRGSDAVMVAASGLLHRAGVVELPPVLPPTALAYQIAGIVAAGAALIGVRRRHASGRGLHIDLSVQDAALGTTDWALASASFIQAIGGRYAEVRDGAGPIYNLYRCVDGWVRVSVVSRREWRTIRAWMGEPEFLQDPHWDQTAARVEARDVIEPLYAALFASMTCADAVTEGQARGLAITPVLEPAQVLASPHYRARDLFVQQASRAGRTVSVPCGLVWCDGARLRRPDPPDIVDLAELARRWADPRTRAAVHAPPTRSPAQPTRSSAPAARATTGPPPPLAGLRVLDLGVAGAAPEVARLLAERGATVVRVEDPDRQDLFRRLGPGGLSPVFVSSNRAKLSFGLRLGCARGAELLLDLCRWAEVLVENLPPGTLPALGAGPEVLRSVNAGLVVLHTQLMGAPGPQAAWRGYGANAQAVGGLTALWSYPDTDPVGANIAFPDHVVGRIGLVAVLAALARRDATGIGADLEISQAETVVTLLGGPLATASVAPDAVRPAGNDPGGWPLVAVVRCTGTERWAVVSCAERGELDALAAVLGQPAGAPSATLSAALTQWAANRSDREVAEVLQSAGVRAAPMMYPTDEIDDPHLRARGYAVPLEQPGLGPMVVEGPGFRAPDLGAPVDGPAPRLGEHTRALAAELLGLPPSTIDQLVAAGTLVEADPPD